VSHRTPRRSAACLSPDSTIPSIPTADQQDSRCPPERGVRIPDPAPATHRVVSGDPVAEVRRLQEAEGSGDLSLFGSSELAAALRKGGSPSSTGMTDGMESNYQVLDRLLEEG